ncbi:MAG: S41 family peptidase [Balneolaceae bacterium]
MSENYIVLKEMEEVGNTSEYEAHLEKYSDIVKGKDGSECTKALTDYINWFDDGHLFVLERPEYTEAEKALIRERSLSSVKEVSGIEELLAEQDEEVLVGKWTDGEYLFGIVQVGKDYMAYTLTSSDSLQSGYPVLSLQEGEDGYEGFYHGYTDAPRYITAHVYKNDTYLSIFGGVKWEKIHSGSREEQAIENGNKVDPKLGYIEEVQEGVVVFEIPSFSVDFMLFRDLILENEQLLRSTEYLIIDARGNTGGNAIYGMFTPLYADRGREESQGTVLASEDNKTYFEWLATQNPDVYQPVVDRINKNMGEIVAGPVFPRQPYQEEDNNLKEVAILTDEACASACESFLLTSKEISDRLTHYAKTNTYGMIDYTSVYMVSLESGNQNISFGYPTGKLSDSYFTGEYANGFNDNGIRPDLRIPDSVNDEIGYVLNQLGKEND